MPYIGNQAGNRFVASQAATRFSGNGSNKVFTLEHSVASDEDILVSVDGVIQEPSISYVVSNGTTLTFQGSDAPSNGTNNIFVCYLFRTVATVDHPSTSALTATNGNFTGTLTVNDDVSIEGSTPTLTLADTDVSNNKVELSYDEFLTIDLDPNNARGNTGLIVKGDSNERLRLDSSGNLTKPQNPSFRAMGTTAAYQTTSPVPFPSVSGTNLGGHNNGSHYNTSNYRFTAPVAGRYLMHVHMGIVRITANSGNGYPYIRINGTHVAYSYVHVPTGTAYHPANITQIVELAANDYVDVTFGGGNSDYYANYTELSFSGYLLG